jgi:hypothetical protein
VLPLLRYLPDSSLLTILGNRYHLLQLILLLIQPRYLRIISDFLMALDL